jgi:hypothetical protein
MSAGDFVLGRAPQEHDAHTSDDTFKSHLYPGWRKHSPKAPIFLPRANGLDPFGVENALLLAEATNHH